MPTNIQWAIQEAKQTGRLSIEGAPGYHPFPEDPPKPDLSTLPPNLWQLDDLIQLSIYRYSGVLPAKIRELKNLKELHLISTPLGGLPGEIGELRNLELLQLSYCDLLSIPPEIGRLTQLKELELDSNSLTNLPKEIGCLKNLVSLSLYFNRLSSLPKEIWNLKCLESLNLAENELEEISKELGDLKNLKGLSLSSNQLTELPKEIGKLEKLTHIDLVYNKLARLPAEIGRLTNLTELKLGDETYGGNQLTSLPPEIERLTSLVCVDLADNKLTTFPKTLLKAPELDYLCLISNPIVDCPAEIIGEENCLEAARAHFADARHGSEQDLELKLIVVGNGRVGKTSILKRLIHNTFDPKESSTHGIRFEMWNLKLTDETLKVNVWDFGGQDIYHGTHRLFLQHRAVFLIVWDRDSEGRPGYEEAGLTFGNFSLQYWLDYVRAVSPGAPVVLVENKCDDGVGSKPPANTGGIPHINYSAQEGYGREALNEKLRETFARELTDRASLEIGVGRWQVKQALREYIDDGQNDKSAEPQHRTISYEHFLELCAAQGDRVSSPDELLRFLHNTGVVFHQTNLFHNRIILDQRWVIDGIYTIFRRESCYRQLRKAKGRFTRDDLNDLVWGELFSAEEQQLFISFMESCSICFRVSNRNSDEPEYIAPELLPDKSELQREIDRWLRAADTPDCLYYCYRHRFLHKGILQQFTVHVGKMFGDEARYWKGGLLLEVFEGGTVAVVECRQPLGGEYLADGEIMIHVQGSQREELLNQLRNEFKRLNQSRASTPQFVSLDGEVWVAVAGLNNADLVGQVVSEGKEVLDVQPFRFLLRRDLDRRLAGPGNKKLKDGMPTPKIPIYISYAWGDERETETSREDIVDRLYQSMKDDGYDVCRDKTNLGYKGLISEFMKEIGRAACVITVISDKYLRSEYCMFELLEIYRNAYEKEDFNQRIFPIVLPDARIEDITERAKYSSFWARKRDATDELIGKRKHDDFSVKGTLGEAERIRDIANKADELLTYFADINTLTPDLIEKNDFKSLKQAIEERVGKLKSQSNYSVKN